MVIKKTVLQLLLGERIFDSKTWFALRPLNVIKSFNSVSYRPNKKLTYFIELIMPDIASFNTCLLISPLACLVCLVMLMEINPCTTDQKV